MGNIFLCALCSFPASGVDLSVRFCKCDDISRRWPVCPSEQGTGNQGAGITAPEINSLSNASATENVSSTEACLRTLHHAWHIRFLHPRLTPLASERVCRSSCYTFKGHACLMQAAGCRLHGGSDTSLVFMARKVWPIPSLGRVRVVGFALTCGTTALLFTLIV